MEMKVMAHFGEVGDRKLNPQPNKFRLFYSDVFSIVLVHFKNQATSLCHNL